MRKNTAYASLIPYLQHSSAYLAISLRSNDNDELERLSNPFVVVDDSSAIGRLLHARFVTDGASTIQELSLFVQRNQYHVAPNSLEPLTNRRIASLWQKAFDVYLSRSDSGLIRLSALTDDNGGLNTFSPLFFCKFRRLFFEPPCPRCGNPLTQCEDDGILDSAGLPSFSSSLHRYLYCEDCYKGGKGLFYVYDREMEDSQMVRDRWELINSFSSLLDNPANHEHLPCKACDKREECFGAKNKASSRISIFSFYPFHMLPFEAMNIHCTDFLALLSGASSEEIVSTLPPAHIRVSNVLDVQHNMEKHPPFFFDAEKQFLELLYLKLVFLRQLADWIVTLPLEDLSPLSSFSIDSFWVNLPEPVDTLPYFWNFKLKPHGLIASSEGRSFPAHRALESKTDFLALAWFFVMLRNAKQDMEKVLEYLNSMFIDGAPLSTEAFLERIESSFSYKFGPQSIFWNPQEIEIPEHYKALWKSCMELGWRLTRARFDDTSRSSNVDYWIAEIEGLIKSVKKDLFASMPSTAGPIEVSKEDIVLDKQIGAVLTGIAAKWESELLESIRLPKQDLPQPTAPPEREAEEEYELPQQQDIPALEETIIVAPGATEPPPAHEVSPPVRDQAPAQEEIPETVIFSSPGSGPESTTETTPPSAEPKPHEPPSQQSQDKEFEKTLSLLDQELLDLVDETPAAKKEKPSTQPAHDKEEKLKQQEEIPETVIIKPDD